MKVSFTVLLSFSNTIAGIIGLIRFRKIDNTYRPFLYFIWMGCLNDLLSVILITRGIYTIPNNNVYVLLEAMMITWFFYRLQLFKKSTVSFFILLALYGIVWALETFVLRSINEISLYFRIFYSFSIVLMSITSINYLLTSETRNLLKNSLFLICVAFINYFTFKVLINSFWIYGLTKSNTFRLQIYTVLMYLNFITNLIYALAVLWIPKKQPSILPSSSLRWS
jgi:hypothetical protein